MNENVCLSGGADGADLMWGMCAGTAGHTVIHWSFSGHRSLAPQSEVYILTADQLSAADEALERANASLNRRLPYDKHWVINLLRRNWYQVRDAQAVYAISQIDKSGKVKGGTAWATQMFIDRFDGRPCPCYVFDQIADQWFVWEEGWVPTTPPVPTGVWAGIGSRELLPNGKQAIRSLLKYQPISS